MEEVEKALSGELVDSGLHSSDYDSSGIDT
jgi:hypothetical protein